MATGCCGEQAPTACGHETPDAKPTCRCGRSHASPARTARRGAAPSPTRRPNSSLPDRGAPCPGCVCHAGCVTLAVKKVDVSRHANLLACVPAVLVSQPMTFG